MNFGTFAELLPEEAAAGLAALPAAVNTAAPIATFALLPRNSLLRIFSVNLSIVGSFM
jgi:hypothetical protein